MGLSPVARVSITYDSSTDGPINHENVTVNYLLTSTMIRTIMRTMKKCQQCKYEWKSRVANPKECPNCKSRRWNEGKR